MPTPSLLIETDVLASYLLGDELSGNSAAANMPLGERMQDAAEPLLIRALAYYRCYTTVTNAFEILAACATDAERASAVAMLSLVKVLGYNGRNALPYAELSSRVRADRGIELSQREAFILGIAEQSKLPVLTRVFAARYRSIAAVQIVDSIDLDLESNYSELDFPSSVFAPGVQHLRDAALHRNGDAQGVTRYFTN